jgi:hypothetical protein
MAKVLRRRVLVNPAKKKRRKRRNRPLTAKQIKFFGTKAQKAARKRRRKPAARKAKPVRSVPRKRRRNAARRRRPNVGSIISLGLPMGNPAKKKRRTKKMAKRKTTRRRRARANTTTTHRRRRRSNPVKVIYRARKKRSNGRRGRRRNPSVGGVTSMLVKGGYTILGAAGSRSLTQAVLGTSNAGVFGYAGNAVSAMLLGWGAKKFLGAEAAKHVTLGGFVGIALRLLQDFTPFGKAFALSGGGDMGALLPSNFVEPPLYSGDGALRQVPAGWGAPAPEANGMRGLGASSYAVSSYR